MLDLQTPRGKVVLVGRVKFHKIPELNFNYEIPVLSFLGIEREGREGYIATCIHLLIDGYGATLHDAINDMSGSIWSYLRKNFNCEDREAAWDSFYEMFKYSQRSGFLWDKYHALRVELAKRDTPSDGYSDLFRRINYLQERAYKSEDEFSVKYRKLVAAFSEEVGRLEAELAEANKKEGELKAELAESKENFMYWVADGLFSEMELEVPHGAVK